MDRAQRIAELAESFWGNEMRHGRGKPLKGARLIQAKKDYADLWNDAPVLFDKIAEGRFTQMDLDRLGQMLQQFGRVDRKEGTIDDVSKEVGEELANEFVKPVVDRLNKNGGGGGGGARGGGSA
jgi:hypothetical protein